MTPQIVIEDPAWQGSPLVPVAERVCAAVAARFALAPDWELTVMGASDARIAALNADFRGRDRPTNVLSWPSAERGAAQPGARPAPPQPDPFGDSHLGDLALAHGVCHAEAAAAGLAPEHHLTHLVLHGVLHLLGYDHETDADAALMEGIETEMLLAMGLADPYAPRGEVPGAEQLRAPNITAAMGAAKDTEAPDAPKEQGHE